MCSYEKKLYYINITAFTSELGFTGYEYEQNMNYTIIRMRNFKWPCIVEPKHSIERKIKTFVHLLIYAFARCVGDKARFLMLRLICSFFIGLLICSWGNRHASRWQTTALFASKNHFISLYTKACFISCKWKGNLIKLAHNKSCLCDQRKPISACAFQRSEKGLHVYGRKNLHSTARKAWWLGSLDAQC